MHASIVVLSALVAVAAGQMMPYWMPFNAALGVPMDTYEVASAKMYHAHAHAAATLRSTGVLFRKRREISPAAETPAHEENAPNAAEVAETQRDKKQILGSYLGYWGGWTAPTAYAATWPTYPHYLYRKRRDVSAENAHEEPATAAVAPSDETTSTKDKRQILLNSWGYPSYFRSGLYNNWGLAYPGYLYRKRRSVSAEEQVPQVPATEDDTEERQKRQLLAGVWPSYAYPSTYRSAYYPYGPAVLFRKRRDAESPAAPEEPKPAESKDKRQIIMNGYGYWNSPYVMPYFGGARFAYY